MSCNKPSGLPRKETPRRPSRGSKTADEPNVTATGTFSNSDPVRQLIHCREGVLLYELRRGRDIFYEIVAPNGDRWRYTLLYSAENKWARLLAKTEGVR